MGISKLSSLKKKKYFVSWLMRALVFEGGQCQKLVLCGVSGFFYPVVIIRLLFWFFLHFAVCLTRGSGVV